MSGRSSGHDATVHRTTDIGPRPDLLNQDLGPDYHERRRDVRGQVAHHVGKLGSLGFEVTLCRIPEPAPDGSGPAQAA